LVSGVILSTLGAVSLIVALVLGHNQYVLRQHSERAAGRVVDMLQRCDSDGCSYRPVVEYEALGETVRITGEVGSSPPSHSIGEAVDVLYRVDAHRQGQIDSWLESWFGTGFGLIFGLVLGGIGLTHLIAARRSGGVN